MGEIEIALHSGMNYKDIVYDSPCKTTRELKYAIKKNINFNIDNFEELARVESIINTLPSTSINIPRNLNIGIRVNPAIGSGTIAETSTATADSKFGINIDEYYGQLCKYYTKYAWLNSIHCHIGSQAMSIKQTVNGIKKTVDLVERINAGRCRSRKGSDHDLHISTIDIGGGLAINYDSDEIKPTFYDFVNELRNKIPVLFNNNNNNNNPNKYKIITEFGRSLVQKSGFIVSKVEYVKENGGKNIAIIHAGAQLFVRTAYQPDVWKHRLSVFKQNSRQPPRQASRQATRQANIEANIETNRGDSDLNCNLVKYDIAGPLCFSGDYVARDVLLPRVSSGDYIIIHDSGGYCYSMFSRYNNRYAPPIYGYTDQLQATDNYNKNNINVNINKNKNNNHVKMELLKDGETAEDIIPFWS